MFALPAPALSGSPPSIAASVLIPIYRAMLTARLIDRREAALVRRGEAFFHISGEGHEALAALALHLDEKDWLACHYRDKGLLVARGVPLESFFATQLCRASAPSAGRQLPDILCDPARNVLSMPVPVGNHALHAVGVAATLAQRGDTGSLVVCLAGDGTTQQGEFLEAVAEAVRRCLPVLFIVEDNRYAISTSTAGCTFLSRPDGEAAEFYGLPISHVDGCDAATAHAAFGDVVARVRQTGGPALVWFRAERLTDHTNADQQSLYRTEADMEASRAADPIPILEQHLLASGVPAAQLETVQQEVEAAVVAAEEAALRSADPEPMLTAGGDAVEPSSSRAAEYRGATEGRTLVMREAIRDVLRRRLASSPEVFLTGQDIEDPKGDVFGVTQELSTQFPGRVVNAALSESTIVGTCIGRALAGQRPVAFLQFADFLPLAFNQIANELGSMHWRTVGGYQCPVLLMVACGGYKAGLGPFHSQTFESVLAHVPGVDVVMPCTAADAAGLLNAAFDSPRPTIFLYPKAALNLTRGATSPDVERQRAAIGAARRVRVGRDLTLVAWGNTVALGERVADSLAEIGIGVDLFDLRSISPWDEQAVLASAERTGRLLVVHEDNLTCGFGAEIVARVSEQAQRPLRARRVARFDTYVPCHYESQLAVLPSYRSTLTAAAELLDLELTWTEPPAPPVGMVVIPAIGSGPSDERVTVAELLVRPGQVVAAGEPVAVVEAAKSVVEMVAPASGTVEAIHVDVDADVPLGHPIMTLRAETSSRRLPVTQEPSATPRLRRKPQHRGLERAAAPAVPRPPLWIGLGPIVGVTGSRAVGNDELLIHHPNRNGEDILRRTGIENRFWISPGEDALTLAVDASRQTLVQAGLNVSDLDLIVCSTGSPLAITPSLACRLLAELAGDEATTAAAYDVNAACSGYLYALEIAHNYLHVHPEGRVLVVTAETPSTKVNVRDFDTAFLFGDAATATLVLGAAHPSEGQLRLHPPILSAKGEHGAALSVPLTNGDEYISMQGMDVYAEAVRWMAAILNQACDAAGISIADLDLIVPHQANQRILNAIEHKLERPVFSNIRSIGNTSSSSIPLALRDVLAGGAARRIGLCAFGGGFTFGAALVDVEVQRVSPDGSSA